MFLAVPPQGIREVFECSSFFHSLLLLLLFGVSSWKSEAPLRMKGEKNA